MKKILFAIVMLAGAVNAFAISDMEIISRRANRIAVAQNVDYNDGTLMNVEYVGDQTSAVMFISSAGMAIEAPAGTAVISTFVINNASYDTLGELCDYLDADSDLECTLTGGKRDDASILLWNDDTSRLTGLDIADADGYSVTIGTGAGGNAAATEAGGPYMMRIGITPASGKRVILKYCSLNVNVNDTDALKVYGKLAKYEGVSDGVTRNDTTQVIGGITTADDTSEDDGNIYNGDWLKFAKDEHVVISAGSGSTLGTSEQASGNFLQCFWDEE